MELDGAGKGPYHFGMTKTKVPKPAPTPTKLVTNRIREIREAKVPRMTIAALASLVNTTQAQMSRLETGERELTEDWMRRIAKALEVEPADLIETATFVNLADEVEPYIGEIGAGIISAIRSKHFAAYRIASRSVENLGILPGSDALFDCSEASVAAVKTGDVVLVNIVRKEDGKKARIVRQFIAPEILTTNRSATRNVIISLQEPRFSVEICGVLVPAP